MTEQEEKTLKSMLESASYFYKDGSILLGDEILSDYIKYKRKLTKPQPEESKSKPWYKIW